MESFQLENTIRSIKPSHSPPPGHVPESHIFLSLKSLLTTSLQDFTQNYQAWRILHRIIKPGGFYTDLPMHSSKGAGFYCLGSFKTSSVEAKRNFPRYFPLIYLNVSGHFFHLNLLLTQQEQGHGDGSGSQTKPHGTN